MDNELGITQEYTGNRKIWDSEKAKEEYKNEIFGDKKTITDENGNTLHRNHTAAKNKYHKNSSKHEAEVDHKISLQSLHEHAKHNPYLSDNDFKSIANSRENYQIISKSENASKGANNSADLKTHIAIHAKFAEKTTQNISSEYVAGMKKQIPSANEEFTKTIIEDTLDGKSLKDSIKHSSEKAIKEVLNGGINQVVSDIKNTTDLSISHAKGVNDTIGRRVVSRTTEQICDSAYSIMVESIEKIVIEGNSIEDAAKYASREVVTSVVQNASEILLDELKKSAIKFITNSNNPGLKECNAVVESITNNNNFGRIVVFAKSCGESLIKYANGEITGEQLSEEILLNGTLTFVSSAITLFCPIPFVRPIISGIIVKMTESILEINSHLDDYLIKEQMIHNISVRAQADMEQKRLVFCKLVQDDFNKWDLTTQNAFSKIIENSFEDTYSLENMLEGLDNILSLHGEKSKFHTIEEWENQLDTPLVLSI